MTMMFRRGLPVASALAGAAALLPGAAVAAGCVNGSLTSYQNGSGCSIGDLTYSNFSFSMSPDATYLEPGYNQVTVTSGNLDFAFNITSYITNHTITIDFTATGSTQLISGFELSIAGVIHNSDSSTAGTATGSAAVTNGTSPTDISITVPSNTPFGTAFNSSSSSSFGGVSSVDISITLSESGPNHSGADFHDVVTTFTETAGGGGNDVPEPASLSLLGLGIAGLGSLKARRRARKALVD